MSHVSVVTKGDYRVTSINLVRNEIVGLHAKLTDRRNKFSSAERIKMEDKMRSLEKELKGLRDNQFFFEE